MDEVVLWAFVGIGLTLLTTVSIRQIQQELAWRKKLPAVKKKPTGFGMSIFLFTAMAVLASTGVIVATLKTCSLIWPA